MSSKVSTALDTRYSDPEAVAVSWEDTRAALEAAEVFWISTVRPDGRPHVTPLVAVWLDGALHFHTGDQQAPDQRGESDAASRVAAVVAFTTVRSANLEESGQIVAKKRRDVIAALAAFAASPQGRRLIQQAKEYAQRPETRQKAQELLAQARNKRKGTTPSYPTSPKD